MGPFCGGPFGRRRNCPFSTTPLPVDIVERRDEYVVYMDAPGMDKADLRVSSNSATSFCLGGTRKRPAELLGEDKDVVGYTLSERTFGNFERCFEVPEAIDADRSRASMTDHVLTVHFPKVKPSAAGKGVQVVVQ